MVRGPPGPASITGMRPSPFASWRGGLPWSCASVRPSGIGAAEGAAEGAGSTAGWAGTAWASDSDGAASDGPGSMVATGGTDGVACAARRRRRRRYGDGLAGDRGRDPGLRALRDRAVRRHRRTLGRRRRVVDGPARARANARGDRAGCAGSSARSGAGSWLAREGQSSWALGSVEEADRSADDTPRAGAERRVGSARDDQQVARRLVEDERPGRRRRPRCPRSARRTGPRGRCPGSTLNAMPGASGSRVAGDQVRLLVPLEPDAVPRPVEEARPEAGRVDDPARDGVDPLARDARPDGAGRLGLARRWSTSYRRRNSSSGPSAGSPPVTQTVRVMSLA